MRYLTIVEILEVAEGHVGDYQFLNEDQLHYLVWLKRLVQNLVTQNCFRIYFKKLRYMHTTSLQAIYSWTGISVLV